MKAGPHSHGLEDATYEIKRIRNVYAELSKPSEVETELVENDKQGPWTKVKREQKKWSYDLIPSKSNPFGNFYWLIILDSNSFHPPTFIKVVDQIAWIIRRR